MRRSGIDGCRLSGKLIESTARTCSDAVYPTSRRRDIATRLTKLARKSWRCLKPYRYRECIGSANPRVGSSGYCSRRRIPTASPVWCCATHPRAFPIRLSELMPWTMHLPRTRCALTGLGNGVVGHLAIGSTRSAPVQICAIGVVHEMDRTPPDVAAAMHDCFEDVNTLPLLPSVTSPVLLLSGDKSSIASAQQKTLAETLPNGRLELLSGYGHGVNLLQP